MTEPNNLQKAMDQAANGIAEAMQPLANQRPVTDAQKLVETCKRLLRQQQDRYIVERSAYETERTEKSNWYRSEMAKLADEAEGEMAMLEKKWNKTEDETRTIIRQIKALLSA